MLHIQTSLRIIIHLMPQRLFDGEAAAALAWIRPATLIVATD